MVKILGANILVQKTDGRCKYILIHNRVATQLTIFRSWLAWNILWINFLYIKIYWFGFHFYMSYNTFKRKDRYYHYNIIFWLNDIKFMFSIAIPFHLSFKSSNCFILSRAFWIKNWLVTTTSSCAPLHLGGIGQ